MSPLERLHAPLPEVEQADDAYDVQPLHGDETDAKAPQLLPPGRRKRQDRRNQHQRCFNAVAAGLDADGDPIDAYITYGLYTLLRGEQMADIMGLIPDVERQTGNLTYEIFTKDRPNSATNQDSATLTAGPTDVILDPRIEGRHFGMTIRSNELGGDFRLGIVSLEVQPSGARR